MGKQNPEDQDQVELVQEQSTVHVECRFFSTQTEYQMCGHGALALAHWLSDEGFLEEGPASRITLKTPEKTLSLERRAERAERQPFPPVTEGPKHKQVVAPFMLIPATGGPAPFMMTLAPATGFVPLDEDASRALVGALLRGPDAVVLDALLQDEVVLVRSDFTHIIIPLRNLSSLRSLKPDFACVTEVCNRLGAHTVAVFWKETESRNCSSNTNVVNVRLRDFCPAVGTDECAATGTTARAVACYLHERGSLAGGTRQEEGHVVHRITLEQGREMGGPSQIACELVLTKGNAVQSVRVGGSAVPVAECVFSSLVAEWHGLPYSLDSLHHGWSPLNH
jgi:predicted PhzF superfamily epimerase YddE/YHI9